MRSLPAGRHGALALGLCFAFLSLTAAQIQEAPTVSEKLPEAAWGEYGLEINNTPGNSPQQNPRILNSDNYYLLVWEDGRSGYFNLYAQKIDEDGRRLWITDGIALAVADGSQNFAQLISDGAGGMIVAWQDYRNGNADIYAQHINSEGLVLWGKDGVPISKAAAGQFAPQLVGDGAGGAIITWHDYRSGSGEDVYAQRIGKEGKVLWQEDGLPVSAAAGTQWYPQLASDGAGGAVITWTDGRAGSSDNNIFAQRVDAGGKLLWDTDGIAVCSAPQNQERPVIVAFEGGAVIAWNDSRSGNIDISAQKLDLSGKPLWQKDGVAVCTAPYNQENPRLVTDGAGGAVVIWEDGRGEEANLFAQRITRDGQPRWTQSGKPVASSLSKQENAEIVKLKTEEWALVWQEYRKGSPLIFSQKLNGDGTPLWQEGGSPLAISSKAQEKACAVSAAAGSVIVLWQDRRGGNYDIFAQKISAQGDPLWDPKGIVLCNALGSVIHQNASLIENGRGEVLLAFEDARSGYFNIYAQKINQAGQLAWGKDGIPLSKTKADQTAPQMLSDGAGGAMVVWEDRIAADLSRIAAQRINSSGKKLWEGGSLPLTSIKSLQTLPLPVSDGAGGAIVLWQDERNPLSYKDLYAQRITGKGELLWGKNGVPVCAENGEQVEASIISDGSGGSFIAWTDFRRGERNSDIYCQRIDSGGKPLWQKDGVLVCGAPDVQRSPQLSLDGEGGILVSWTDKGGGSYDIYAQRLNARGETLWSTDGIPVNQMGRTQQNPVIGGTNIIVWEDYRYGNWDLFANALSPQGKLLWGEEGIPVVSVSLTQYAPRIIPWKKDSVIVAGVIIAWEDYRSGKQYQIFLQKLTADGKVSWQNNGVMIGTKDGAREPKLLALPKENALVVVWEDYTGGGKALYGQKFLIE
jgi:hypothetical protein